MKVLEVGINKKEFEKFCEEKGLNPEKKISKIRYVLTFKELEGDARKILEELVRKFDAGKIKEEDLPIIEGNDEPEPVKKASLVKGIEHLVKGMCLLATGDLKDADVILEGLNDTLKCCIAQKILDECNGELNKMTDVLFKAVAVSRVVRKITKDLGLEEEKEDKPKPNVKKDEPKAKKVVKKNDKKA